MAPSSWPGSPESLLEAMFQKAPIALWVVDRERRYVRVNETAARMNGLPVEAHIGRSMGELLPEVAASVDPLVAEVLATGEAIAALKLCTPDPRDPSRSAWFLGSGYPVQSASGEIVGVGIVAVDITARKLAEEALHQSETRFRQLAENVPAVFWLGQIDPPKAIYVSPAFERIWGRPRETHHADPLAFFDAVHPDDRAALIRAQSRLPDQGFDLEFRIVQPDGSIRWVHDRAFPVPAEPGVPRRAAGITTDVTEHKRLEEQLRQAQKMESLGRLAGGMAHDFNNLMTAVLGHASFAAASLPDGHEARAEMEEIEQAALRAAELTRQLLAFARLQVVAPRIVDVNALVASLDGLLRRLIGEDVELATELEREPSCARIDPSQLEQVLVNLAVNARDAMPGGGRLVLGTSCVTLDETTKLPLPRGRYVCVSVRDTGHGIGEEAREHLFEPFFTTKPPGKGTGLGLATCYGIVRQCGGHIAVESAPGEGARFDVYLPRTEGPASLPPDTEKGPLPRGTETVLLVEDEPPVRRVALRTLRAQGYRVLEASDGDEALARARAYAGPIHLLVTDVVMPRMGGIELAQRLRALRPETRVLHVSGYVEPSRWDAPAAGGAFLQKPFLPETLARKVREVLDAPAPGLERARAPAYAPPFFGSTPSVDLRYSEADEAFRRELRAWLEREVPRHGTPPPTHDWAARRVYDTSWQRKLCDAGYAGINWPKAYGGRDATLTEQLVWYEETARAEAPYVGVNFVGLLHGGPTLIAEGTPEQKARHIPRVLRGEEVWCQGFSEPSAGSDLASLRTSAVREGDHYVVSGQKIWCSFAQVADYCELLVRTDPNAPKHKGISWLILPMDLPGITIRPLPTLMGEGEFSEVFLDGVRVPVENRVGAENDGWRVTNVTLRFERGTAFASEMYNLQEFLRGLVELAKRTPRDGAAAFEDRALRRELGHLAAELDALWAMLKLSVCEATDTGVPGVGASAVKLFYTELYQRLTEAGMRLLGRAALSRDDVAGLPNARILYKAMQSISLTIAAGSSQIQRNIIGERILGLPKDR